MQTSSPREAIDLIRAKAEEFAEGKADDPKALVDGVMSWIEAALDQQDAHAYLDGVTESLAPMLKTGEGDDEHTSRRLRFLRSIGQLLNSRRAVSD